MNLKYCLTGILCLFLKSDAQEIKSLTIGDKVPDVTLNNIYNYPALQSSLSAFNNKLIIFDFMASTCISCLKALPRFDSIQKIDGDKLQIFLVTYEKKDKVIKFLQKHNTLKLPIIGEDTILKKHFPHTFISHEVWIKNGVVIAITPAEYVTDKNIRSVLSNEKIDWPIKRELAAFQYAKPLLHLDEEVITANSIPSKFFYSLLSTNISDVAPRFTTATDSIAGTVKTSFINMPVIALYLHCIKRPLSPGYIMLQVKDTSAYVYYQDKEYKNSWTKQNTYCFESVLPLSVIDGDRQEKMRSDLDLWLGLHGRLEKRKIDCFVINRSGNMISPGIQYSKDTITGLKKISVSSLIYFLNQSMYGKPAIDETGYKKFYVWLDKNSLSDTGYVNMMLEKYGLRLTTAQREIEMFVLSKK